MKMQTIKSKDLNENVKELLNGANCYECYMDKYAPMNVPYNQLLYMKRGNELIAVKIIMASYFTTIKDKEKFANCCGKHSFGGWCYLFQTPYGMEWINQVHDIRFFFTKEDYFKHLENGCEGFSIKTEMLGHLLGVFPGSHYTFKESWKWNGHCAERTQSCITNMVINENGLNIILSNYNDTYWSKEDCIKANINGMKIVDFPETENSIKVSIEVVKTPPIVRTITLVEG